MIETGTIVFISLSILIILLTLVKYFYCKDRSGAIWFAKNSFIFLIVGFLLYYHFKLMVGLLELFAILYVIDKMCSNPRNPRNPGNRPIFPPFMDFFNQMQNMHVDYH